jgi:Spy/CpxP family protein refolding chaperone
MIMSTRTSPSSTLRLFAVAAAAVLALTGVALAQSGPMHAHGAGPGGGIEIEHVLGALKGQLNLNTSQQLMWDNAVAQTQAAHAAGRANMQKAHDALTTELAKPEPDLVAVAAVADGVQTSNQTLRHSVRDLWLQLYGTFSPEQKTVVKTALAMRVARMDAMRARMQQRTQ